MRNKKILAGPWLGEFGWELMRWQGIFRRLNQLGHSVTMIARSGHEFMYEDYASDYIPAETLGLEEAGATDGWRLEGRVPRIPLLKRTRFLGYQHFSPLTCMKLGLDLHGGEQSFIPFHVPVAEDLSRCIVVHARNTDKAGSAERNWPREKWDDLTTRLTERGFEVVAIGTTHQSLCPSGARDVRGIPLRDTVGIISNAAVVVGPSSGPMHLASLCAAPHVVWTDQQIWSSANGTSRQRYEQTWNPLATPVRVVDAFDWQPPVNIIEREILTIESIAGI